MSDIEQMRMSLNAQEKFWAGEFGNDYTNRNRVRWRQREPFWRKIDQLTGARSYYEFGCNAGWNLSAIRSVNPQVRVWGEDINLAALDIAICAGLQVGRPIHDRIPVRGELTFTAGVLIHIAPENLKAFMQRVIDASCIWVVAVEYEAEREEEIEYRGHAARLWKRPFGKLYEAMGLRCVDTGVAEGFDRCTYWLMEKP